MISSFLRAVMLAIACTVLVGCIATPRNTETIADAEVGPYPTDYQFTVQSYFEQVLKDPDSAQYKWPAKPFKGYARLGYGETLFYGWLVPVQINAKNSYGGYAGWTQHHVLVVHDNVVHQIKPEMAYPEPWYRY